MIKETITYGSQNMLTIYHHGFDEECNNRRLKINEKIGRYRIIFEETYIPDKNFKIPDDYIWKNEFLLKPDDPINPYNGGTYCAKMIEYFYAQKPKYMFRYNNKDNQYNFAIELNDILKINEFTKKYTGMDLTKYPFKYGNTFIFEPHLINIELIKDRQLFIKNLKTSMKVTVHFKIDNHIVCTNLMMSPSSNGELTIIPNNNKWKSFDIFIYENDEIFYEQTNISFLESVQFDMHLMKKSNPIKLPKLGETISINYSSGNEQISVGNTNKNDFKILFNECNTNLCKQIMLQMKKSSVLFIQPGEQKRVIELIQKKLVNSHGEIWIFDSYFTDKNKVEFIIEWLNVIEQCLINNQVCNIVFCYRIRDDDSPDYSASDFKRYLIDKHQNIVNNLHGNKNGKIILYQTQSSIHDRFIIIKNEDNFSGLGIGTSFNSIHANSFCIYPLDNVIAKEIFEKLLMWLDKDNNLQNKVDIGSE